MSGSGGQVELDYTWDVLGRYGIGAGILWWQTGKPSPRVEQQSVAPLTGVIWIGATGYGRLDLTFSQLWYEHHFVRDRVFLRVGRINPFAVFDYYKYKSPGTGFLGQPQNVNPTIPCLSSALGLGGAVRMNSGIYLVAGAFDANGVPTRSGFDTLFDVGEYFVMGEIGWPRILSGALLPDGIISPATMIIT